MYSIVDLSGSQGQSNFTLTFGYLSTAHVHVYIDSVETTAFTFSSATVITLDTPLTAAATVRLRRITPIVDPIVDFSNGSVLGETDLDAQALQVLYAQQELDDFNEGTMTLQQDNSGQWDATNLRIINVANPVAAQDAVTKAYLDAQYAASPAAHSIFSHNDADTGDTGTAGDILAFNTSGPTKLGGFPIGTNLDVLEVDTTQTFKLRWRSLASKLFQMLTTKGDLMVSTGATVQRKAAGTNGYVLKADSTQSDGLAWVDPATISTLNISVARSVNLRGSRSAVAAFDFTADVVILTDATGQAVRRTSASGTNTISTAGPAANGRDQAGAFSASSWVHFYWIWNGTTLSTLSSATGPSTGPTLPATYTHWCYITTLRLTAGTLLSQDTVVGNEVFRDTQVGTGLLLGGAAKTTTGEDTLATTNYLPTTCVAANLQYKLIVGDAAAATTDSVQFAFGVQSGAGAGWALTTVPTGIVFVSNFTGYVFGMIRAPYAANYYATLTDTGTVSSRSLSVYVSSYTVCNNS